MSHPRQTIREAVTAQLIGTSPDYATLAGARVYETRFIPLKKTQLPAIMVYTVKEPIDPKSRQSAPRELKRDLELVIEGVVDAGDNVDDSMDALAEQIECAVDGDDTFGVSVVGNTWLSETEIEVGVEGDRLIGMVRLRYTVTYYTNAPCPDCAPTLEDFTTADVKWSLQNQQAAAEQAEDTFDVEE